MLRSRSTPNPNVVRAYCLLRYSGQCQSNVARNYQFDGTLRDRPLSFVFRRKFLQQVRPVASDDPPYLVVDLGDVVEAFLNLLAEHLKLFRAEGTAVQELDWHTLAPPRSRRHRV